MEGVDSPPRPLSFLQAAGFQWVNPKAWVFAVSTVTTFTAPGGRFLNQVLVIAALFVVVTFAAVSSWCLFGVSIRGLLKPGWPLTTFNLVMAALLAGSVLFIFV